MKARHLELLPREAACGRFGGELDMADDLDGVTCRDCLKWLSEEENPEPHQGRGGGDASEDR